MNHKAAEINKNPAYPGNKKNTPSKVNAKKKIVNLPATPTAPKPNKAITNVIANAKMNNAASAFICDCDCDCDQQRIS
jgi:hypothetical protein